MLDLRKPTAVSDKARVRLFQLYRATKDSDVVPSWPTPTITLATGAKLTIPPGLYDSYVETVQGAKLNGIKTPKGEIIGFKKVITTPQWYTMGDAASVKLLKNQMTKAGSAAKAKWVIDNYPALLAEWNKLQKQTKERETR